MSDNLEGSDELETPELEEPTVEETAEDESEELEAIELDGEEVTLEEIRAWKAGHMMQADYTRKTMDLSNQRKQVTETLNNKIADLDDKIHALEDSLDDGYTDAELDELFETDPQQFRKIERARQRKRDAISNAKSAREKARIDLIPAEQQALTEAMPEWSDKEKGQKTYETDIKLAQKFMTDLGYTPNEIQNIVDHRVMKAVILAARYNNLKTSKPEVKRVKPKAKPSKPGKPSGSKDQPKTLGQILYG